MAPQTKLRVLCMTRYGPAGPSSRYRMYQFLPSLRDAGFDVVPSPLFDDSYVGGLYSSGKRDVRAVVAGYIRRTQAIVKARRCDVIWLEKELFPFLPPFA